MAREIQLRWSSKDHKVVEEALTQMGERGARALKRLEDASKPASKSLSALDGVAGDVKSSLTQFTGSLGPLGAGLQRLGPLGLAAGAGIGALALGFNAALDQARAATEFSAELEASARRAGVTIEAFQELTFVGRELRITQEALFDGFKELNLRADEFAVTGAGAAAEAYQRLGLSQGEVNSLLSDSDLLFEEVIRRMEGLDDAAQIRLADELFGGQGGEQFVSLVRAGADEINRLRAEARSLGAVVDGELIRRGADFNAELEKMNHVIDVQLNAAFVDLAPLLIETAGLFADVAKWASAFADAVREIPEKTTYTLEARLPDAQAELAAARQQLEEELERRQSGDRSLFEMFVGNLPGQHPENIKKIIEDLDSEIVAIESELAARQAARRDAGASSGSRAAGGEGSSIANDTALIADLNLQLKELGGDETAKAEVFVERLQARLSDNASSALRDEVMRLGEAIVQTRAALEEEAEAERRANQTRAEAQRIIEATRTPQEQLAARLERLNELYKAGEFGLVGSSEAMETLTRATEQAEDGTERLIAKQSELGRGLQSVGNEAKRSFGDIITGARSANDAISGVLDRMASVLADQAFDAFFNLGGGSGGFLGGLGALFSADGNAFEGGRVLPFARGGVMSEPFAFPLSDGRVGIGAEAGPEAIMPLTRLGDGRLGVASQGGGRSTVINQYFDGAGAAARDAMREAAAEVFEQLSPRIVEQSAQTVEGRNASGRARFI